MEKGWKQIFMTGQDFKAQMAKDLLEQNGIEALIMNHKDSTFTTFGDIEVYVREEDEEKALDIIKNLKSGEN